jgi:ELWxxDGT repeat protein
VCPLAAFRNELYFTASDPATGVVILWRSSGLAGGQTRILAPNNSTFQSVVAMRQAGTALYFIARVDGTPGLWRIAGEGAQPTLVMQYANTSFTSLAPNGWIESLDSVVVYPLCNTAFCRLARSDGTMAGTFELSPNVPFFFQPWSYLVYDGKLLFQGGDASGFEPWITDGSVAGTRLVKDLVPGLESSKPRDFINFNGLAYFQFDVIQNGAAYSQLWRTDGTEAGTERVNSTPAIAGTIQNGLFPLIINPPFGVAGDRLYFPGSTLATGTELYVVENEAPAAASDTGTTQAGTAITLSVLGNDSDPDGILLNSSLRIAQAPANGSTSIDSAAGSIRYTPNAGFSGSDSFTYQIADKQGRFSTPAAVNITVAAATVGGSGGTSGSGSSGGGGSAGLLSLLALAALAASRTRCRVTINPRSCPATSALPRPWP